MFLTVNSCDFLSIYAVTFNPWISPPIHLSSPHGFVTICSNPTPPGHLSPYRAPELLFAPRQYDAYATDLWSLGVLASNFFTSLRFDPDSKEVLSRLDDFDWDALIPGKDQEQEEDEHAVSESDPNIPFNLPVASSGTEKGTWHRMQLFDSTRGEIGLVASIFKLLGTPTEETWPVNLPRLFPITID